MIENAQNRQAWKQPWPRSTPEGRWYGLGRYLAMFPPSFVQDAVDSLTKPGEPVLDPFCGRGNGPFTAAVMGRPTVGIDVNPVAWLFTAAKLQPAPDPEQVIARLKEVWLAHKSVDRRGRNRFETMAWAPKVRGLLRAARRELDWRESMVDRTLMAFIALHMQDKSGGGLSNSFSPTIAYSPGYAVRWWTDKGLLRPPDVDPVAMLTDKIRRRYHHGTPGQAQGTAILGDAREVLPVQSVMEAGLLITSPPYCGVADYWNDHWLRLWLLGHNFRKDWRRSARYENKTDYKALLMSVLRESGRHLKDGAAVLIRTDRRRQTAKLCIAAVQETWPNRKLLARPTTAPHKSISVHHGRGGRTAKEIDLLLPGERGSSWWEKQGFQPVELVGDDVG